MDRIKERHVVFVIGQDVGKPGPIQLLLSCSKVDSAQSQKRAVVSVVDM